MGISGEASNLSAVGILRGLGFASSSAVAQLLLLFHPFIENTTESGQAADTI